VAPILFAHRGPPAQEKSGRIDYHELKVAIRALGFDIKKAEALRLVEEHDVQGSGTVGLDDFLTILTAKYASRDPEEELRKAFELFDAVRGWARVVSGRGDQPGRSRWGATPARNAEHTLTFTRHKPWAALPFPPDFNAHYPLSICLMRGCTQPLSIYVHPLLLYTRLIPTGRDGSHLASQHALHRA
jgi:hypothetical protein